MCNLYSITTNQAAIIALFRVINRFVGNLPPVPGVFPDYPAPVVRNAGAVREMLTCAGVYRVGAGSVQDFWR
jgi:putative SOS response-associated peptidase YedK